jgi:hypothetical protein
MRAWQHRWETWAGRNLGLERWDLAFGVGQARRLSRTDHALSDSAAKLADGNRPIGTSFRGIVVPFYGLLADMPVISGESAFDPLADMVRTPANVG